MRIEADVVIEPGVVIYFESNGGFRVDNSGSLKAVGNDTAQIILRGENDVAGSWKGLFFNSNNVLNELSYVTVSGGGNSSFDGNATKTANIRVNAGKKLKIHNCTIDKSGSDGLFTDGLESETQEPITLFRNNTFTDNQGYPLNVIAPVVTYLDSTGSTYTGNQYQYIKIAAGKTIGDNLQGHEARDREVIRPFSAPLMEKAGFLVLSGNLFDFGIMKTSVISEAFRTRYLSQPGQEGIFEARAVVFDGADDYHARINDPALDIDEGCILVMRGAGPMGWPGSAEVVNMQPPDALIRRGINTLPTLGDGRQSGTADSPSILNVSPESAVGGGLCWLQSGDRIRIDLNTGRCDALVAPEEVERRRRERQGGLAREERVKTHRGQQKPEDDLATADPQFPRGVERHIGRAQPLDRHGVDTFRRRPLVHLVQMQTQQVGNRIAGQVVFADQIFPHGRSLLSSCP